MAASIRQKLLNKAKAERRPFSEILQYYTMERFLHRLSQSPHSNKFVLKGALVLRVWNSPDLRPTMDIDMLGKTSEDQAAIFTQVLEGFSREVTIAISSFSCIIMFF